MTELIEVHRSSQVMFKGTHCLHRVDQGIRRTREPIGESIFTEICGAEDGGCDLVGDRSVVRFEE